MSNEKNRIELDENALNAVSGGNRNPDGSWEEECPICGMPVVCWDDNSMKKHQQGKYCRPQ